ncbi:MAG TPA: hypothetical protein DCR44_02925, partial [Acholeplasmatales bacterium]|nr:hypothetical protein [Acholeplasmatales bacterium]
MKKIKKYLLLLTIVFLGSIIIPPKLIDAETNVNVSVTSYFDENNTVVSTVANQVYGSKVSFASSLSSDSGYTFVFWIYNGVLRVDLPLSHQFIITSSTTLIGVFRPNDKLAAVFIDTNGKVLDIQYVTSGESALDLEVGTLPTKPGYVVAATKWDHSLTNITANTVFTLQYSSVSSVNYTLAVTDGSGDGTYSNNSYVTVTADAPASGKYFDHWDIGGRVASLDSTYTFTLLENTTITAVYGDSARIDHPMVGVSSALSLRSGYHTYLGHFELPPGYELIEHGLLVSSTADLV